MSKMGMSQRWMRAGLLFLGLRNLRIREAMQKAGFTQADSDEGRALWEKVADVKLGTAKGPADPNIVQRIDEFENYWFPIAGAALGRKFPDQHARVFLNLVQTDGIEVIASVGQFVKRVAALESSADPKDQEARQLLVARGLNAGKMAEIKGLLDAVSDVETDELPAIGPSDTGEEFTEADEAAWAWYLEWSTVARTVIKDRRSLKALGFLKPSKSGADGEEEDGEEEEPAKDAKPAPAPAGNGAPVAPTA